jgi:thioredoxin 1
MSDPEIERIMRRKMAELLNRSNISIINLNKDNIAEIINSPKPVLIDFWAEWCGPCRMMHPIFEKLAKIYGNKIIFARLNVDENQEIAMNYEVYAIPTFIIFSNGKIVERLVGAVSEDSLRRVIEKYIE